MLILVALGVVLILGSQYSKISVLDLLKLEGRFDKTDKKVDKLIIYTEASTAEINSHGETILQIQKDLNSLRKALDQHYKQQSQPE